MRRERARWNGEFDPSAEQHAAKRRLILREAGAAFNRQGFRNVSLDDVAVRLGISKTVCYYYFRDKNHLLLSCVELGFEFAEQALAAAEALDAPGLERVVLFTREYVCSITSELGSCAVLNELHSLAEADLKAVRSRQRAFGRRLIRLIEAGRADSSIAVDDPRAAVSWIVSPALMIPRLTELWGRRGVAWMADSFAEFTRRSLSAG